MNAFDAINGQMSKYSKPLIPFQHRNISDNHETIPKIYIFYKPI